MSQEIESFIADQESRGLGTRQQILDHFRKSDDPDWKNYFANQNKANVEEKKQTLMDMATTPHPVFGVSPLDMLIYGGGAALTAGAAWKLGQKGAEAVSDLSSKAYGSASNAIKNRWMGKPAVDVSQTVAQQQPGFTPSPSSTEAPPVSMYSEAEQEMIKRSAENAAAKAQEAEVKRLQGQSVVPGGVAPAAAPAPVAPTQITPEAPKSGFAWDQPQTMQPTVTQAVEAGVSPTQALQVEVAKQLDATPTQTTQPAEPTKNKGGRPTKAAKEAQLAGGVFKEGFGGADNWMQSQVGHDIRRFIRDEFNAGKPYGGGQAAMEKAYADIGRYEQWLKENIPVQTLNRAERKALGVPSPEPYGPLGKAMKVGGVAGLLMTAAQAANAKQAVQNVGEALLPIGMTPSELATGTLTEKQLRAFQEAQKLGSPYRSVPPPR